MKVTKINKSISISLTSILVLVILIMAVWLQMGSASITPVPESSVTPSKYDPAYYGLPNEIAGYPVLAVENSDIQPCATPGILTLVIQVPQANVREYLRSTDTQKAIREGVRELDPSGKLQFRVVGPGKTHEQIQGDYATLESRLRGMGCPAPVRIGDIPPLMTRTPTSEVNIQPSLTPVGD